MDNASKALLMAGGILTAILIIGILVLMINQISVYQKQNISAEKEAQLATFNQDFARYADEEKLNGTDIITLANKVVDFNKKQGITNSVDYDKKITLKVDLTGFADKYGVNGRSKIFDRTTLYEIKNDNNTFMEVIIKFSSLENKYTLSSMSKLSSNYDSIADGDKTIKQITGKDIDITIEDIEKYREYSELKISTFEPTGTPVYEDGQIKELSFKFVK